MTFPAAPRMAIAVAAVISLGACTGPSSSATPGPQGWATASPGGTATATPPPETVAPTASPVAGLDLSTLAVTLEAFAKVPGPALAMAAPEDGTGRLFVATQDGYVWEVGPDGQVREAPLLDLDARIATGGERGLLGIALHPAFPDDPRIFVDYTDNDGHTVVASLTLASGDDARFDPESHQELLFVEQPYPNHNGGALAFGPDGYLYVSLGDGGSGGDPHDNGQRLDTLLGKVLRVDVDDTDTYLVPGDNPYASGGGMPEIWLSGLRNPWRMSFDRETGDLWIGDVGQGAWEEIDVAPAGEGGLNFGWRVMEGSHCFNAQSCRRDGLALPVTEYGHDQGCTVIGGYVYRGAAFPFLRDAYLFADYCSGHIFAIDSGVRELTAPTIVGNGSNRIAAWGEDTAGELYVMALDGTVSQVVASRP